MGVVVSGATGDVGIGGALVRGDGAGVTLEPVASIGSGGRPDNGLSYPATRERELEPEGPATVADAADPGRRARPVDGRGGGRAAPALAPTRGVVRWSS